MSKYVKVKQTAFDELQKDAGLILSQFDPTGETEIQDEHILFTTTGGITPTCTPTYIDFGADIDNCPNNMMELMEIDDWECGMTFTALNVTPESVRWTLGAADVTAESGKITPRRKLKKADFKDLWWVGATTSGGFAACCLKNALSDGGFSIRTTKKGKGNVSVSVKGHPSIATQDDVPMEFYVKKGSESYIEE